MELVLVLLASGDQFTEFVRRSLRCFVTYLSLHEKMDLQQLQNQCKYEVNTTFDQICLYLPRGKFHRWIIFAREAKMVNTAFTQSLQSKANEKKKCTFASDLT